MKSKTTGSFLLFFLCFNSVFLLISCSQNHGLPIAIPTPADNPITDVKVELGRQLFFDKRLSINNSVSCATCHNPKFAMTDRLPLSKGVYGRTAFRNAPSILNAAYLKTMMFDGHVPSLEMQAIVPLQDHAEMGHDLRVLIPKLRGIALYQTAAREIFNRDFDAFVLTRSLAAFQRTLVSFQSKFDLFLDGESHALSASQKRGWALFSGALNCVSCHPPPFFTSFEVANNGIYFDYRKDEGRFRIHNDSSDIGKFKIPSLRNVELTAPYMHDGSMKSIDDVLNHYAQGGKHPKNQDKRIRSFVLSTQDRQALKSFLTSLTDTSFIQTIYGGKSLVFPSF